LRIYKLSQFIILADNDSNNFCKIIGKDEDACHILNPGCFIKNKTFYMIHPFKKDQKKAEECRI
jgi:hypothetical protein